MENFIIRASLPFIYLIQQIDLIDTPFSLLPQQPGLNLQHEVSSFFPLIILWCMNLYYKIILNLTSTKINKFQIFLLEFSFSCRGTERWNLSLEFKAQGFGYRGHPLAHMLPALTSVVLLLFCMASLIVAGLVQ